MAETSHITLESLGIEGFGVEDWKHHYGYDLNYSPIPEELIEMVGDDCPFWPDKKIRDTHMLTYVPSVIGGKQLTLRMFDDVMKNPTNGKPTKYHYLHADQNEDDPIGTSAWILMVKECIPNSLGKPFDMQKLLVYEPYSVPKMLHAAVSIVSYNFKYEKYLYFLDMAVQQALTGAKQTWCAEKAYSDFRCVVGCFGNHGLWANIQENIYFKDFNVNPITGLGLTVVYEDSE